MSDTVYKGDDFDQKVRKQVEFYFSDSNLQTDKFLWRIYEANDGWVELKTILTFGRMRQYRPEDKVIEALKASDKLVLSSSNDMVRRKDPLKDFNELKNTRRRNSVHIEGFPKDATQEDLEEWFATKISPNLPVEKTICSLRRHRTRAGREFLGVADVEFKTQEDAEYFLNKIKVVYPEGVVEDAAEDKDELKKMSLLTYKELKESGKRFGVNEVTKRRSSFNDPRGKKKFKGRKESDAAESGKKEADTSSNDDSEKAGKKEPVDPQQSVKPAAETAAAESAVVSEDN